MKTALAEELTSKKPDQPLIEAVCAGDRYAFGELLRRHDGWVRAVIYGVLGDRDAVDDVAQQVWTSCWQRAKGLRDPRLWRTWLYRLARNAAVDAGREKTRRRRQQQATAQLWQRQETHADSDRTLTHNEEHRSVLAAIEALPALYREPFVLRHLSGWSYKRIADVMDMPVDTVETRLVRARRLLRESLKDQPG